MEKQLEYVIKPTPLAKGKSLADCFRDDYINYLKTSAFCVFRADSTVRTDAGSMSARCARSRSRRFSMFCVGIFRFPITRRDCMPVMRF